MVKRKKARKIVKKIVQEELPKLVPKFHYQQVRQYLHGNCRYVIVGSVPPFSPDAMVKCRIEYNLECSIASQGVYQKPPKEELVYLSFLENVTVPLDKKIVEDLKELEVKIRKASTYYNHLTNVDENYVFGEDNLKKLNKLYAEYIILQKPKLKSVLEQAVKKVKKKDEDITSLL